MSYLTRCQSHLHGPPSDSYDGDRCVLFVGHADAHRWDATTQLRYVEHFDILLCPDAVEAAWRAGRVPEVSDFVEADTQLARSRSVAIARLEAAS